MSEGRSGRNKRPFRAETQRSSGSGLVWDGFWRVLTSSSTPFTLCAFPLGASPHWAREPTSPPPVPGESTPSGASRPLTREHLSLLRDPNQGQRGAEVTPGVEVDSVNIRTVSLKRLSVKRDIRYSKKRSYPSFDSLITPLKYLSDLSIALISLLA